MTYTFPEMFKRLMASEHEGELCESIFWFYRSVYEFRVMMISTFRDKGSVQGLLRASYISVQ